MKKAISRVMLILLTFLLQLPVTAGAQTSVGLGGGGSIFAPVISPSDPTIIFTSCDLNGLYRSTDSGQHWNVAPGFLRKVASTETAEISRAKVIQLRKE